MPAELLEHLYEPFFTTQAPVSHIPAYRQPEIAAVSPSVLPINLPHGCVVMPRLGGIALVEKLRQQSSADAGKTGLTDGLDVGA